MHTQVYKIRKTTIILSAIQTESKNTMANSDKREHGGDMLTSNNTAAYIQEQLRVVKYVCVLQLESLCVARRATPTTLTVVHGFAGQRSAKPGIDGPTATNKYHYKHH